MTCPGIIRICVCAFIMLATLASAQPPPPPGPSDPVRGQRQPPPPVPAPARDAVRSEPRAEQNATESLVHGPVHEAFAAPSARDPQPPLKLSELPPEAPEELPPSVGPQQEGEAARWIPGYWGWDARQQGYVWVSGTWRSAPPEMEWVPGYWATTDDGCRWVAGFWARQGEDPRRRTNSPPHHLVQATSG